MPCLIETFKQMRRSGLIAKRKCYCENCGREMMLQAAQQLRTKQRDIRGLAPVGEWEIRPFLDQLRVPLVFSSVTGDAVCYRDPGCQEVGEFDSECLKDQGFPIRMESDARKRSFGRHRAQSTGGVRRENLPHSERKNVGSGDELLQSVSAKCLTKGEKHV